MGKSDISHQHLRSSASVFQICLLLPVILLAGCYKTVGSQHDVGPRYTIPDGLARETIDGVTFAYVAPAARREKLLSGYAKLKVGQTREEVRERLGLPDVANPIKQRQSNRFCGWHYIYYPRRHDLDIRFSHISDQDIQVIFDDDNKLTWVHADNMADLGDVGSRPLD